MVNIIYNYEFKINTANTNSIKDIIIIFKQIEINIIIGK